MVLNSNNKEEDNGTNDGLLQSISISLIETNGGILNPNLYNKLID